jgi:hypothetical protein
MSGVNTSIYPLPDIIQDTLDNVAVTNSNLQESATFLTSTNSILNIVDNIVSNQAEAVYDELFDLNYANGLFLTNVAGRCVTEYVIAIPAVATPTTVASITIPDLGTYLIHYSFQVLTNTPNGDPTPLTSAFITWTLAGDALANNNYSMTFYPNYAIREKKTFEMTISGTFPIYVTESDSVLAMRVNNAPEDGALATEAIHASLTSCYISPYFPV